MIKTSDATQKKLLTFFRKHTPVVFHKGQSLYEAQDKIDRLYYVESGFVRQYVITEDGEEITLHIFKPGSYLPIMLAYSTNPNRYTFSAQTQVKGYRAPTKAVLTFIEGNHDLLLDLTKRFAGAINGLLLKIENELYKDAYRKVASTILYLSDTFGKHDQNGKTVSLPFSHVQLASWTGLQRETVSRQIEKMQKKGILKQEKKILIVHDRSKVLNEISGFRENPATVSRS